MKHIHNKSELLPCILGVISGKYTAKQASLISGYSTVRIRQLVKNYKIYGDKIFINGHTGKKPANKKPEKLIKKIVNAYLQNFQGYNFKFFYKIFCEENPGEKISYSLVYKILSESGIKTPEKRKVPKTKIVHRPRPRRQHEGELLQIDATPYDWFGDGNRFSLHGSIDDATGKITALVMCENECLYGYFDLVYQTFFENGFGHPSAIYSDKARCFCYTPNKKRQKELSEEEIAEEIHEERTQWQRAMNELGVKQILAWSPQAKGRIERLWSTLQGRLPWYFKKHNINTIERANEFLKSYIKVFNDEFSVIPESKVKVWHSTGLNPDYVLSARYKRKINQSGIFSFHKYKFKVLKENFINREIEICVSSRGIKAYINSRFYDIELVSEKSDTNAPLVFQSLVEKYMYAPAKKNSI